MLSRKENIVSQNLKHYQIINVHYSQIILTNFFTTPLNNNQMYKENPNKCKMNDNKTLSLIPDTIDLA